MELLQVRRLEAWSGTAAQQDRSLRLCERLERGDIVCFEHTPFELPQTDCNFLVSLHGGAQTWHKNIAYRPKDDRLTGFDKGTDTSTLLRIFRDYSRRVSAFIPDLLHPYAGGIRPDMASFRPVEEEGRDLALHSRNDLIHVDSFPTRPMNGDRILRIFTNINPTQPRVWVTSDPFEMLAENFAVRAGLMRIARKAERGRRLHPLRTLGQRLGLPGQDRSPYDQFMIRFHNWMKQNRAFQETCAKYTWKFPPRWTWLAFTDTVPHSVRSGKFALEHSFIVKREVLALPDKAPVSILERLSGARLTL